MQRLSDGIENKNCCGQLIHLKYKNTNILKIKQAGHQLFMLIILNNQKAEIRKTVVQGKSG
jgi:hypothetical protein